MTYDAKEFITNLGGYRSVALRLGKKPTTVHTHMQAGVLPAAWYDALCGLACELGQDTPERVLFSFVPLVPRSETKGEKAA